MHKIAILSDIHGNILALEKVVEDLLHRQVDTVINLGDHVSGPLWPKETVQFLMKQNWIQIAGNHERQLLAQDPATHGPSDRFAYAAIDQTERDWLHSLPTSLKTDDEILIFHGTPASDLTYLLETIHQGRVQLANRQEILSRLGSVQSRMMACGHSHVPRLIQLADQTLIINPGSVGLPAYEDDYQERHIVETGSPCARYAILEKYQHHWVVDLISIPYEFEKAAERAQQNNRPDWEMALRTGFMNS
ncbi:MAG TPA: metallophosphoesterase family protein [Leptolinea sp.]